MNKMCNLYSFMDLLLCERTVLVYLNRESYMSAFVLLNLLNELRKRDKCVACRAFVVMGVYPFVVMGVYPLLPAFYLLFATSLKIQ